jgi:chemotaxis protein methyltransferase CheR
MSSASIAQPLRATELLAPPLRHPANETEIIRFPASSTQPECQDLFPTDPRQDQVLPSSTQLVTGEGAGLCQQGEALLKQHRYDEARQCFLSCLAREPNSIRALYWMASLEANVGRLDEARTWAEKALHQNPLLTEIHYTLALIHEVLGELQEAVNRLKKVIYLDPNFILAHFGLFHLYQRTGNPTEAGRHRTLAVHLASKLSPDAVLPGSDDLTAGQLLTMARVIPNKRSTSKGTTHSVAASGGKS